MTRLLNFALLLALSLLAGCASGGNPNGDTTPSSNANNSPGAVPVGNVASNGGNVVTQTGKTVWTASATDGGIKFWHRLFGGGPVDDHRPRLPARCDAGPGLHAR